MRGRVLLGTAFRAASPIRHPSRPFLAEVALHTGVSFEAGGGAIEHRAVYVVEGAVQAGGRAYGARFIDWNFVSSSRARIDDAKAAWRAQTFPRIPGDDQEHAPLPG
jgi:redox-sensitive bicupin YhaK (pirin superfamily)